MPSHATTTSFQVGWKGGPGRPRRDVAVTTARDVQLVARSFSLEALRTLVSVMRNPKVPALTRVKAAEALLTRGVGLPVQPIDVVVSRVLAKRLAERSLDELRALEQHLANAAIARPKRATRPPKPRSRPCSGFSTGLMPDQRSPRQKL
jgi:hypothetical protein